MKLIASDLDGTLLNENGEVSLENANMIKKAMSKGIQFVVATGRSYTAALKPLEDVGITCPIICLNGANIYNLEKQLIKSVPMDLDISKKVLSVCRKENMYIEFFTNNGVYSVSQEYFLKVMVDILKTANPKITEEEIKETAKKRFQDENISIIDDYDQILTDKDITIYKILVFSLEEEKLSNVYETFKEEKNLAVTSSGHINLEFNDPGAQKGIALEELVHSMGMNMSEVMALGDNLNDKDMLIRVGRGVAMGNAADEIIEICKFKTRSNIEHGVAYAIEEMLKDLE